MNIEKELLKEHSKRQADKIANYACRNKENFKKLIQCYLSGEHLLAQRAAWSVSIAARKQPEYILPYIKDLVEILSKKNVHNAVIRNSVRTLETLEIPRKFQGKIMQTCFRFLEDYNTPVATKVFSMTTLYNLSKQYPEIKSELKSVIEDRWEHESAAFKSRGRKVLSQINKETQITH